MNTRFALRTAALPLALAFAAALAPAQTTMPIAGGDIIAGGYKAPEAERDYIQRKVMIPMRDGVKLFTVISMLKGTQSAPIILTRTPYNAAGRAHRSEDAHLINVLPLADEDYVRGGYIRVYQDVRGKYGSEGDYVMTRPVRGPLNDTKVDHVTDAYDTIDWLVKNTPESNGKVGMIGSSYEGFTVVMALLDPHPALKAAVPESPMVDGWMGDDWFHYGAFRQNNVDYFTEQMSVRGEGGPVPRTTLDEYTELLRDGSAGGYVAATGVDKYPFWQRLSSNPGYDAFWQGQALDKLIAAHPPAVPTMWEQGLWDQEDMWGAIHSYLALKAAGAGDHNYIVMGPWFHSQVNREGLALGPLQWNGDTALQFRHDFVLPFFNQYLKDGPNANTPAARIYNTAENHWDTFAAWPTACAEGCKDPLQPLYLEAGMGLGFTKPAAGKDSESGDSYISDPAKPVPYSPRPVQFSDSAAWRTWLVHDQRFVSDRTDVLVYETDALTAPVRVQGAPVADIFATTTGTDTDWVVKVIDVYPDANPSKPDMAGYELPISLDIFRGRYRESFEHPTAIPAGKPQEYRFGLPTVNHVFEPGHRIMVQVQSSAFPLYDRNPQTFVPNIFFATKDDYKKATITVLHDSKHPSAVLLPVVP